MYKLGKSKCLLFKQQNAYQTFFKPSSPLQEVYIAVHFFSRLTYFFQPIEESWFQLSLPPPFRTVYLNFLLIMIITCLHAARSDVKKT
jgi:hypothetical protein